MSHQHRKNLLAAYSLLEILVTMAIFGVLSVALIQSLLLNIRYSGMITARSQIRSELDQAMSIIQRDIRNANDIDSTRCNSTARTYTLGTNSVPCQASCYIKNNNKDEVVWCFNNTYYGTGKGAVTKWVNSTSGGGWGTAPQFRTSPLVEIQALVFSINTANSAASNFTPYANILVTLQAQNTALKIQNQVRQISVTTRNYTIK